MIGLNIRFDEQEKDIKRESSTSEENETSDLEVLQDSREIGDSLLMAIDDGPIGRFATGMPTARKTQPDVLEKATILDPEVLATNSNEDEDADESTDSRSVQVTGPRRSTRIWKKAHLFPGMRSFAMRIGITEEPVTFKEALEDPQIWHESIAHENRSHKENGTWKSAKLPPGRKVLTSAKKKLR